MQISNLKALERARHKHPQACPWLDAWVQTAAAAQWQNIVELRSSFPAADGVRLRSGIVMTIFNASGNKFRLLTAVNYRLQLITVVDLLTHAEYNKGNWKGR